MHICNLSFSKGIFPLQMKITKVIPIFKSGDKSQFNNYRPISVLSQFSKIFEKLFYERLKTYIDKHVLLSDNQYGFRSNRSTSLALLELVEKITKSIDDGKYTIGIFIDIKKAFDTIDHNILLQKLHFLGVRGVANSWLTSYLSKRMQYVEVCVVCLIYYKSNVECHRVLYLDLYCLFYILMLSVMYQRYLIVFFLLMIQICFVLIITLMTCVELSMLN